MIKPTRNKELYEEASKLGRFTRFSEAESNYTESYDMPKAFRFNQAPMAGPQDIPVYKFNARPLAAAPQTSTIHKANVDMAAAVPQASIPNNNYRTGNRNLRWAYDPAGVVYQFDRGVLAYSKNGDKKLSVIDDDVTHHADLMYQAAAEFGTPIEDTITPMGNALNANEQGMTILMFEGATVQIYLPENPPVEVLEDIKKELEPRQDFTIEVALNGSILFKNDDPQCDTEWTYDEISEYLDLRIQELKAEQQEEACINTEKDAWLLNRLAYIRDHKSTPYSYFYNQWLVYKTLSKEILDMLKEVDPFLDDATIDLLRNNNDTNMPAYYATIMTQAMNNAELRQQQAQPEETEEEKLAKAKKEYYDSLQAYTQKNNISTEFYFYALGNAYKQNSKVALPEFEKQNPFLTKEDIDRLMASDDDRIVEYFAHSMNGVMDLYKKSLEENKQKQDKQETVLLLENKYEQDKKETPLLLEDKYEVSEVAIDSKVSDSLNGFAVRNEIDTNKVNVYAYEAEDKNTLKGKKQFSSYRLKDGYYVNINEYMTKLTNSIVEEYPEAEKITIKTAEGEEIPYAEFCERAFSATAATSTIRIGRNYTENNMSSYQDTLDKYDESPAVYGNTRLQQGVYVRKSALDKFAKDYKFSITSQKQAATTSNQYSK